MRAFGPVPSRRLGQSVGINNIPPKICTYSCVYCQLGKTIQMETERRAFYSPEKTVKDVEKKIAEAENLKERIDYLTFVPDGEPTLDINLGREIRAVKEREIPVAVITNASLIGREEVREDLSSADWVSLKIDAVSDEVWRRVDRPHKALSHKEILSGMELFADEFNGVLTTETMLIRGVNDASEELEKVADLVTRVTPDTSYLSIPTRPPAEDWVTSADERTLVEAFHLFSERGISVEHLIGYEGDTFASTGNVEEDLLSIVAVHPMRERGVRKLVKKADADWEMVERLVTDGKLQRVEYRGKTYYTRKF